jgi:16S rRNA (guanine1207-N2)-methyltransferase
VNEVFSKSPASTASPRALPRPSFDFSALRREPDVDDDTLLAYDATDELLLARAAPLISGLSPG